MLSLQGVGSFGQSLQGSATLTHSLREGHRRLVAERDALAEELAALKRSQRATRCCTSQFSGFGSQGRGSSIDRLPSSAHSGPKGAAFHSA